MEHDNILTQEQQEELSSVLLGRIQESAIYLGVPDWYEIKYGGAKEHIFGGHIRHSADSLHFFIGEKKFATANHIARVTLDSLVLADALGFGIGSEYKKSGELFIESAIEHDTGKMLPQVLPISEKTSQFNKQDRKTMKDHVWGSLIGLGEKERAVIADHHRWQKCNPYTPFPPIKNEFMRLIHREGHYIQRTPLTVTLSKLLGIIDCHDSAATRANTRNSSTQELLSAEKVREVLMKEYGALKINYSGKELPTIKMRGGELIEMAYSQGIFGREDVFNPYPTPYSFIKRPTDHETNRAKRIAENRARELDAKMTKYSQIEHEQFVKNK